MSDILKRLEQVIESRRGAGAGSSYVASLFAKGEKKIAEKVGEEAVETVIAALGDDKAELTAEVADLIFHLLILLNEKGVSMSDVEAELARRKGLSGLDEKAARTT